MKQHDGHISSTFLHVMSVDKGEEGFTVVIPIASPSNPSPATE